MNNTIKANVTEMFGAVEPCYVSGSIAELGESAGRLTWANALIIAGQRSDWLKSDETEACEAMREWAHDTGAWEKEEIAAWSVDECLALFVQNVASEMRMLGSDDNDFETCAAKYAATDWDNASEYPTGSYFAQDGAVWVDFYAGC